MSVCVRTVARGASRTRNGGKQLRECPYRTADQFGLNLSRKKTFIFGLLRIPVFVPDPRHAPVNVRRARMPKPPKKFAPLPSIVHVSFHCHTAEMRGSMQCRIAKSLGDAIAVSLPKAWPPPPTRDPSPQRQRMTSAQARRSHPLQAQIRHNKLNPPPRGPP